MASSQPSQNVELEAAKFLQKLIHDSKDEPAKLATKLFVILQHMRSSGKEHSMPYQVISRAMETVISQNNLDIEALMSSRLPPTGGGQGGDSGASSQYAGSSPAGGVGTESKGPYIGNDPSKVDLFSSSRPPVGPGTGSHDYYQGSGANRSNQSFDHESPSSLDTKSANSHSQERGQKSKDGKKGASKRRRGDSSLASESHVDSSQQLDHRKGKLNNSPGGLSVKESENASFGQPEAPSVNVRAVQQGGSLLPMHESLASRVSWNQSKAGLPLEKSQVPRFSSNSISGNVMTEMPAQQSTFSSPGSNFFGSFGKIPGGMHATSGSHVTGDTSFLQFGASEPQKNGIGKSVASHTDKAMEIQSFPTNRVDDLHASVNSSILSEQDGGNSTVYAEANYSIQGVPQNSSVDTMMARTSAPRDLGKSSVSQNHLPSGMPFKEHQLKQLRAQCLVFLAFRNGLIPKKLHLEVALGSLLPKDGASPDGHKEMVDQKGKAQSSTELSAISDVPMAFGRPNNPKETDGVLPVTPSGGRLPDGTSLLNQDDQLKSIGTKIAQPPNFSAVADERKYLSAANSMERVKQGQETMESDLFGMTALHQSNFAGNVGNLGSNNPTAFTGNGLIHVGRVDQASPSVTLKTQHELLPDREDDGTSHFQRSGNMVFPEQEDDDNSASGDSLPSPRYTMSEKWIADMQRKRVFAQQKLMLKQQKTKQRISVRFEKLKEVVSLSEDLSAKTKSVIELKKLQLLQLQHRLRSEFLCDFFKPITTDMDRLKSYKKHKHGRRTRQLEKFEQKMKEERQKRIRERQKEFFSEIEVHKERVDDIFKIKKERWKGFNRYVKEFHKRKERIHREKIDRIQREKINLLKINDVEGYLRMVQDAKSDRVKQLLKETEKYLQKLGSKLRDAKVLTSRFETDMDETKTTALLEKNETSFENDDESDQAKHYLESNEKYYLMAHSIKESIAEQPTSLVGGTLREYQMNGLRWLVSLYNNHLNGILADEMGLGKTVQVISLICYLMETKNDRGPFLVVVPSSVLPGWETEINFWAPGIHKIVYSGPPEERRRLFKEQIVHQKFNVLLTTYEYLMNKHDRPKLSKVHWHYIIIDEGHRIKNASCKLNADLKHYQSSHRLLLTGTPLQNNLEELWALLNFLLPNIFNSSEDFSQWFNKPFEGNGDSSAEEALLSEEENLLIINRLHQVLRPFVLRRLKHKVENQLPEKIERLIRCEASAYQKLLMRRVEENLGSIGNPKARSVHNSVMELRNICNHPYLSQLHSDEVDNMVPRHFLPNIIRYCGKLEMLDRLLPKLKATDHRVLFFSTMTRLLDIMEEYLTWKQYRYLRLDGHTAGGDRGALIDQFNHSNSPYFIFLLSIRAGGVGVNLQAADTVIIFDTDWNPQVDLQAQARAHRIGQKRDVLVLRFETVKTVEEQVRASAEHKLGVANQSITAGFFDNNTSAEDRREYLEALLRECKKEEDAPVLDDDALNDLIARSESEIDIFESIDKRRRETETGIWKQMLKDQGLENSDAVSLLPSRLVTDDDLKAFYEVIKSYDVPKIAEASNVGMKRKGQYTDTQHYGRGKRAREVRSYEEQWTEEEFEKLCQSDSPGSPSLKEEDREWNLTKDAVGSSDRHAPLPAPAHLVEPPAHLVKPPADVMEPPAPPRTEEITPPPKRGRGRPRRVVIDKPATAVVVSAPPAAGNTDVELLKGTELSSLNSQPSSSPSSSNVGGNGGLVPQLGAAIAPGPLPVATSVHTFGSDVAAAQHSVPTVSRGRGRKVHGEILPPRRRGRKPGPVPAVGSVAVSNPNSVNQSMDIVSTMPAIVMGGPVSGAHAVQHLANMPIPVPTEGNSAATRHSEASSVIIAVSPSIESSASPSVVVENKESNQMTQSGEPPRRRGRKPIAESKYNLMGSNQENEGQKSFSSEILAGQGYSGNIQDSVVDVADAVKTDMSSEKVTVLVGQDETRAGPGPLSTKTIDNPSAGSVSLDGVGKLVHEVPVAIASASQPISGFLPVSLASQSSPADAIHGRRQGRRGSSGVEGPRRRGRRPGSASSKVEVSVGLDPKLDLPTPYKSRDVSGSMTMSLRSRQETDPKLLANVVQESNSPGVVARDLKRKEPGVTPTVGQLQTADVTGVARLMKEIFSESSSFKNKTGDSSRSDSRSTTHARAFNNAPMEVPKSQSSDDKAYPTSVPTLVSGVTVDSSRQSGTTISIDFDDGPPGFGSNNKKDSMSKAPLMSSPIAKSGNDSMMAVDPSGSLSGDSKSPPVQDLLNSKTSCEPSPKETLESSRFSLTPDAAGVVEGAGAGEFKPTCSSSCDLGLARSPAVSKKDPATESQPSLKESESPAAGVGTLEDTSIAYERSIDGLVGRKDPAIESQPSLKESESPATGVGTLEETSIAYDRSIDDPVGKKDPATGSQPSLKESESPAADVGTFEETSIAYERSVDDPVVDVSASATKDADMGTVRSDMCPAEVITAEYTGVDDVKSQATLDNLVVGAAESQPSLEETETPAAVVGNLKESSIAFEMTVDDPLVDAAAPAAKDADTETVRSDLCPAEAITAEYTGEDVVKGQAVSDNLVIGAADAQPLLTESESPAAGVGTFKETSIASERSGVSVPAIKVADVGSVRSDSCSAEAITAEYNGEDVKSQAVLDNQVVGAAETQPLLKESEDSLAAGVGTLKETSIASERSCDDLLVDTSAPPTKDADVGFVTSDSCPVKAIITDGEDVVKSLLDNIVVGAAETQPSPKESEESPAADVGTIKDPLMDITAPATKDTDVGTVRSDSYPGEAMTAQYTGEDAVKSQAVLDNLVAETQSSLKESEESPAADVGFLKETSIASASSVDDRLVDVSAPAAKDTVMGTVRSDSCPGEAMAAEYTGEDVVKSQAALDNLVVGTAEASRDETELPCAYNDHNSKSMPGLDIPVTSKCIAAELADFCALEKQTSGGMAASGCSSLKEDIEMIKMHQGLHKGNTEHNGSTEDADLSNSSLVVPQDIAAISAGLQIIEEKVCPIETKLSDRSMPELDDTGAECGQTSPALEDSTAHLCSALENERMDGCQDGLEQTNDVPQVADRVITDVGDLTLDIQQDGLPLPSVVMEENKIDCLSNESPAGGISALEQPPEAEITEDGGLSHSVLPSSALMLGQEDDKSQLNQDLPLPSVVMEDNKIDCSSNEGPAGGLSALEQPSEATTEDGQLSQPGAPPNHSSKDGVLPSSAVMLEQEDHKMQLDQGLCGTSDLAEKIEDLEAKEIGGTDISQGSSSLDNVSESLPLPLSCLVTVEGKGSIDKDSVCQSVASEPDEADTRDDKDDSKIGLNDFPDNTTRLYEQMAPGLSEKDSESLSTDSGNHGPMETNQVEDLVSSQLSGSVFFCKPILQMGENRNESSLERDPPGCSGAHGNIEVPQPEVADQMMVDVSVSAGLVTRDASQTCDSISPEPESLPISSPLMIVSAVVEGSSEASEPKLSDQMIASNTCISAIENSAGVIQPASLLEEAMAVSQPETDETGIAEVPGTLEGLQAKVADPTDIGNACVSELDISVQPTSTSNQVIIESQTKISETEGGDQLAITTTSVSEPEKLVDMVQPEPILEEHMDGINQTEVSESRAAEGEVELSTCTSEPESVSVNLVPPASLFEEQTIESQVASPETAKDERKNEMNLADPCASQSENTPRSFVHLTSASEEVTEVQREASATGETEICVEMRVADACVSDPENESAKVFLPASSEERMNGSETGGAGADKTTLTSVPEDHQLRSSAEKESCEDLAPHTDEEEPEVPPEDDLGKGDTCAVTSLDNESGNMDLLAPLSTVREQSLEELHPNISGETTQHDEPVSENLPDDLVSPSAAAAAAATEEKINALFEDNLESDPNGTGNEPGDHNQPMLGGEENAVEPSEDSPVVCPSEAAK